MSEVNAVEMCNLHVIDFLLATIDRWLKGELPFVFYGIVVTPNCKITRII